MKSKFGVKKMVVLFLLVSQTTFAGEKEGCRDISQGPYDDDNFPVSEQVAVSGGYTCRCLDIAIHPQVEYYTSNFAQVVKENGVLKCSFRLINNYAESHLLEIKIIAARTCIVKFIGVLEGLIPMKRISDFKKCIDEEILKN